MTQKLTSPILTRSAVVGRMRGVAVGAAFGAGWAVYGLSELPLWARACGGAVTAIVLILLMRAARQLMQRSRDLPPADAEALAAGRRARFGFIAVLVAEIVLLNVAVAQLSAPALHTYWIPAIAAVVGLHFLPLAWLFRVKAFWACGLAMTAAAAVAALAVTQAPAAAGLVIAVESLFNAVVLWLTATAGLASLRAQMDTTA